MEYRLNFKNELLNELLHEKNVGIVWMMMMMMMIIIIICEMGIGEFVIF